MEQSNPAVGAPLERQVRPAVPERANVDALMKRCQIGVGGRHALDNAHDIMAECYGTLGALMLEVERLKEHAVTLAETARLVEQQRIAALIEQHSGLTLETLEYLETMRQGPTPAEWAELDRAARAQRQVKRGPTAMTKPEDAPTVEAVGTPLEPTVRRLPDEGTNASGSAGTYGCACVSGDARNCALMRSGYRANCDGFDERCECLCHNWRDDDDE